MNITIFNGNPDGKNKAFIRYLTDYADSAKAQNHTVTVFNIADMKIGYCTGCFSCWLKTPGICVLRDDAEVIYRHILKSQLLIFASPLYMGFVSAMTRKINERLIPFSLPYITFYKGECHHFLRYGSSPVIGLLLDPERTTDDEDIKIITDCYSRLALNFQSTLKFVTLTTQPIDEALYEISNI